MPFVTVTPATVIVSACWIVNMMVVLSKVVADATVLAMFLMVLTLEVAVVEAVVTAAV